METNRFARADLEHMLVMVDDDMKLEALPQTNCLKLIITADLPLDLEKKSKQSYQGELCVRFVCFGNGSIKALCVRDKDESGQSRKSIRKHLVILNGVFKEGITLGELTFNPCANVKVKGKEEERFEGTAYEIPTYPWRGKRTQRLRWMSC